VLPAGQIEADPQSSPKLRFSDGSEVALLAGSKGTLRSVDAHGARVSLAAGGAHVDVAHVPGAHWLFDAGPFLVTVTGTAFTIGWDPVDERLDVEMDRGSVEVRGPLSDGPIPVRAGQHLVVRVREHETWVRDRDEEATAPEGPRAIEPASNVPPSPPAGAEAVAAASASHATRALGERNWSVQLARGNFDDVLRDAERAGIATCLAQASSDDLSALADAARYSRHDDVARRALVALRRRFPRSPAARDASFLLGRLEEAEQNHAKGIEWYDRYLVESPNGTYAPEALGRKMNLTQSLFGDTPAREVASEYLSRFPQGMYAARARTLSQSP
jgi:TolA-binding protein